MQLAIDRASTSGDIRIYLTKQIDMLIDDELLPHTAEPSRLVDHLIQGADGMFLWARLMMAYLNSTSLTQAQRFRTITDVTIPEGLDDMYGRILKLIVKSYPEERRLARQALLWLTYPKRNLTTFQLNEAITVKNTEPINGYSDELRDFQETIITVCGGLVELCGQEDTDSGRPSFRFIHLSVKEYFAKISKPHEVSIELQSLIPDKSIASLELAACCLRCLKSRTPPQPPFRHIDSTSFLLGSIPTSIVGYAAAYWMDHLSDSIPKARFLDHSAFPTLMELVSETISCLSDFLNNQLTVTFWIHAYYLYARNDFLRSGHPPQVQYLTGWVDWVSKLPDTTCQLRDFDGVFRDLHELAHDIGSLARVWNDKLQKSPGIIWDEVNAFARSRFLYQSTTAKVTCLAPKRLETNTNSSRPLCDISATASDGSLNGVLSIWPSRNYENHWQDLTPDSSHDLLQNVCSGWIARYEVWSVQSQAAADRRADIRIPLDTAEIMLQMRQSFRQEYMNGWKTSFPMVISDDTKSFIILRTLFVLTPANETEPASCKSVVIPMDFSESLDSKWTDQLRVFNPSERGIQDLPPTLRLLHHDWYTYSMIFSPNRQYLFFSDDRRSFVSCLAVFKITVEDDLKVSLMGSGRFATEQHGGLSKVIFHPTYDFIIFRNGTEVGLWHFKRRMHANPLNNSCIMLTNTSDHNHSCIYSQKFQFGRVETHGS